MTFKQKIYNQFLKNLKEKIDGYQFSLDQLSESVLNETKSTAGDKHETALSMLQLEQSQVAKHMYEAIDAHTFFVQLNLEKQNQIVQVGSLVKTNHGYFLISVALPKITIDDKTILAISSKSPLGIQLLGKKINDKIIMNSIEHEILEIY